jgi:hypothetical protein
MKLTPKTKKIWLARARAAGSQGWAAEVALLKPMSKREDWSVRKAQPGDQIQLDDDDSASPYGTVTGVGHGVVQLMVEAQAVLEWLEAA